jgi:hypothetical protein
MIAKKTAEIEFHPDAWQRFERAVDAAVKSGPKRRTKRVKDLKVEKSKKPRKRRHDVA